MKRYMIRTVALLLLLAMDAAAQTILTGTVGATGSGLGSQPGTTAGFDADFRHSRFELSSRFTAAFGNKLGSAATSRTISERFLVRYGQRWRLDAGLLLANVTGAFGSRTVAAPLIGGSYVYQHERHRILAYLHLRPFERGTNYTREHATRGIEGGVEIEQHWGRLITKQAAGFAALWFRNVDDPTPRQGAAAFVRGGIGVSF